MISPHNHCESYLTASTLANMIAKAKKLRRTHFAYTDQGSLSSALKAYTMAKKEGLKPILGMEFYFYDPSCKIVSGTPASRCSYFQGAIYCKDQAAYQELVKIVSRTDLATIQVYDDDVQLFTWKELEHLAKFNTELVVGGSIHDMVGKVFLAHTVHAAACVFLELQHLFQDRFSVALLCEKWDRKFSQVVEITYKDGTKDSLLSSDKVTTDKARNIKCLDLITKRHHTLIKSKNVGSTYYQVGKEISSTKLHRGYLPLPLDASLKINKLLNALARKYEVKVMATDYAFYCDREDKVVQELVLEGKTKLYPTLNMKSEEEIVSYLQNVMGLDSIEIEQILKNNNAWAEKFNAFDLKYEPRLADSLGSPIKQTMEIIQANGRMKWDNPTWIARLKEELAVIEQNGVMSMTGYFLPIHDVLAYYKKNNRLTGPGRGSAAGSLLAYLMGITQVDPFRFNLSFNRFYSMDRIRDKKLADIDSDLEDRDLLVGLDKKSGYLYGRWGNKAAQISTRTMLRLKSSIKDTNRYVKGKVESSIEIFSKSLPAPPQGVTDQEFIFGFEDQEGQHVDGLMETSEDLLKYTEERPEEWDIVQKMLGITRAQSIHACAFVIADRPIADIVPTKFGHITQYTAAEVEAAGLVKYDFLVISQLKDIRICLDYVNKHEKSGASFDHLMHNGIPTYIWDLPEELEVFKSVWGGDTESIFQISTKSMIPYVMSIKPQSIEDLAIILSLVRPGPLDYIDPNTGRSMAEEYVHRRQGGSYSDIEILKELIPETYSVLVYQEQITKIAKELAGFDGSAAEKLREAIGKKKLTTLLAIKPKFVGGCTGSGKVTQKEAEELWERIATFGRYAFNKSHAISYAFVTYACMFLRHHRKIEWWAAVATNAEEKEITGKFWNYLKPYFASPDINLSTDEMVVDYANNKIRAKLGVIRGLGDKTATPIINARPYKDINDFVQKDIATNSLTRKLIHVGVLDSLFPPQMSFLEKLKMFEDCLENRSFHEKKAIKELEGKVMKQTQPKEGRIPEEYLNLHPMEEAAMKKAVLPSLVVGLYDLGARYSKALDERSKMIAVNNSRGISTPLISSEMLLAVAESDGMALKKDFYLAATGYINEISEFPYSNNTKKALKLNLDFDGISLGEMVQWPDYNSGDLVYDQDTKKGSIVTVFFRKKMGKKEMSIQEFVLEATPKKKKVLTEKDDSGIV